MTIWTTFIITFLLSGGIHGFQSPRGRSTGTTTTAVLHLAPASKVEILPSTFEVSAKVHKCIEEAAREAIADRGHFCLAIPGGSLLTTLSNLKPSFGWPRQTTLVYVNHKCVKMDDLKNAIHAKAKALFLDQWKLNNVIVLDGTDDATKEAESYQTKMETLSSDILPRDADGFPILDLCLIGVGDDGHIGSLYPKRDEINEKQKWVVGVDMKIPPSITLTLPVMLRAKQVVVAVAGRSDKYPQGKADAMRLAVEDPDITPAKFPACALREKAQWFLDKPNASKLKNY